MAHALTWFEIPVKDVEKARKFYETILGKELASMDPPEGYKMYAFPTGENDVGGAIMQGEGYTPSNGGAVVYLYTEDNLTPVVEKVEAAGGKVLQPIKEIGPMGFFTYITDIDGNRVGLHSMKR